MEHGTVYPPLTNETRERVDTKTAAFHLCRSPKTLRTWINGRGPISPKRVNGRLMWSVRDLKQLLEEV
jgi:hypothetical protein